MTWIGWALRLGLPLIGPAVVPSAQTTDTFTPTGSVWAARYPHTATQLQTWVLTMNLPSAAPWPDASVRERPNQTPHLDVKSSGQARREQAEIPDIRIRTRIVAVVCAVLATGEVARAQSVDLGFDPGANGTVWALAVQADGKVLVGGDFTTLGGGGIGTTARNKIGRLNPDGSLDTSFNPGANSSVLALAVQADGKILVGGAFTTLGGGGTGTTTRNYLGRLNADGSLDATFNPGAGGAVQAMAVQSDGKILVGGGFWTLGGGTGTTTRYFLGRLNADGSLDTSFNPGANSGVLALAVQADGKILVGGFFTTLGGGGTGTTTRNRIGRLNADGSLDTAFNPGANLEVYDVAVQADGKILVGGLFTTLGGGTGTTSRNHLGRLNVDGSLDTSFNPGANSGVLVLAVQADGRILVGGTFTTLGGGTGTTSRNHLGRLNVDGSLDTSFNPGVNGGVDALAVQADGKILVGGNFTTLGGGGIGTTTRTRIGRLNADASTVNGFVFPVLGDSQSEPTQNWTNPGTDGWSGSDAIGTSWPPNYGHLGRDYWRNNDAACTGTIGRPVYAVAAGTVVQVVNDPNTAYGWPDDSSHGWGRVIVIKHTSPVPFDTQNAMQTTSPNEAAPTTVYTLYGHVRKDTILVAQGDTVFRGQHIADIGKASLTAGTDVDVVGWSCSHLHFEIKTQAAYDNESVCLAYQIPGVGCGYSNTDGYAPNRYIPSVFITNNRGRAAVSQGVTVTPTPVLVGQQFSASFTLRDTTGSSNTFEQVAIAILAPDGTFLFDMRLFDNVTVPPGGIWNGMGQTSLFASTLSGVYRAVARGKKPGGNWFDFETTDGAVNPRLFQVVNGADSRVIALSGNLAFGSVQVGTTATATLTISNTGSSTLTVTSISYPTGFSGNWSGTVAAGGSRSVTVTFAPTAATTYTGSITVHGDQTTGTNTISVSGTGTTVAASDDPRTSWLFGADSGANDASSTLQQINSSLATFASVGESGVAGVTDVAFLSDGRLFGVTYTHLVRLDPRSGTSSMIGSGIGVNFVNALTADANGVLYAATLNGALLRVNPESGRGTIIGTYGSGLVSAGDLAFGVDGTLYGTSVYQTDLFGLSSLVRIDIATGRAAIVGGTGFSEVFGLAFGPDDRLYGVADGDRNHTPRLIRIDTNTGAGTEIARIPGPNGMFGLTARVIRSPVEGSLRMTGVENPLCNNAAGLWTFCQHRTGTHAAGRGIQGSNDTFAWDANLPNDADRSRTVYAAAPGRVVRYAGVLPPQGNSYGAVLVEHSPYGLSCDLFPNRCWWTGYLHLLDIQVAEGQVVDRGTILGRVGDVSPDLIPAHLHFVVYVGANRVGELSSVDAVMTASGVAPATSFSFSNSLVVDMFNVDDVQRVKVNGGTVGQVNYGQTGSFNLTSWLNPGLNVVEIELENLLLGWTYGLRLWADGVVRTSEACGQVGSLGCLNQDHTLGVVYRRAFLVWRDVTQPTMTLDKTSLRFGAVTSGTSFVSQTAAQVVRLTQNGTGTVTWTATPSQPWLRVSPVSGTGSANLSVNVVSVPGLPVGSSVTGAITLTFTGASNAPGPITVSLDLIPTGTSAPNPFGVVDTPLNNTTGVTGAVPFTGWALDDVGVARVMICRAAFGTEVAPGDPNCGGARQIYVGDAVFIDGARPDVLAAYPAYPLNTRGGWGFMVLTNMLPNQGNGTYLFYLHAQDRDGHTTLLGTRTMTCANASATKPFGAIDTPTQGGSASGASFVNFGWALTPQPKIIPIDGSTITVLVDGTPLGTVDYNHERADIEALFPGFQNTAGTNGAIGFRVIDTTTLTNGLHTISWTVVDNQGAVEGIGSRFFTVSNGTGAMTATVEGEASSRVTATAEHIAAVPQDDAPVLGRRGWDPEGSWRWYGVGRAGRTVIRGEEIDRFELWLEAQSGKHFTGHLRVGDGLAALPVGSQLNAETGQFTWAPGVGFVGTYDLVFVRWAGTRAVARHEVRVILAPKGSGSVGPQVVIDAPRSQQDVGQPFVLRGWAADLNAATGTGIATLHAWAYPLAGGPPVFLGAASYGGARPDVAAVHGDQFEESGFGLHVQGLAHGNYDLAVFAWSTERADFVPATVVRVTIR